MWCRGRVSQVAWVLLCAASCSVVSARTGKDVPLASHTGAGASAGAQRVSSTQPTPAAEFRNKTLTQCTDVEMQLLWAADTGAPAAASAGLADVLGSGARQVLVSGESQVVTVLDGDIGAAAPGWPYVLPRSSMRSPPAAADVDGDGVLDVLVGTDRGELLALDRHGRPMLGRTLKVPKLPLAREWFNIEGKEAHDKHLEELDAEETRFRREGGGAVTGAFRISAKYRAKAREEYHKATQGGEEAQLAQKGSDKEETKQHSALRGLISSVSRLGKDGVGGSGGRLSDAGVSAVKELAAAAGAFSRVTVGYEHGANPLYSPQYEAYVAQKRVQWQFQSPNIVNVDAHIRAPLLVRDIAGRGTTSAVVGISYFFDKDRYSKPRYRDRLRGADPAKYVASGVALFDLRTLRLVWHEHLETATAQHAHLPGVEAAPVAADVDDDGEPEIIVASTAGNVFILSSIDGSVKSAASLHAGVVAAPLVTDIDGDGRSEIVVADVHGTVAALSGSGSQKWAVSLGGPCRTESLAAAMVQRGESASMAVFVPLTDGRLAAVDGRSGALLPGFPMDAGAPVRASPAIVHLANRPHVITATDDGSMVIAAADGSCASRIDIGERSRFAVLSGDVAGSGGMQIVLLTESGSVLCYGVPGASSWESSGRSSITDGAIDSHHILRVRISDHSKRHRDISGEHMTVSVEILDERPQGYARPLGDRDQFRAVVRAGSARAVRTTFTSAGRHSVTVPIPKSAQRGTVRVEVTDGHGALYTDEFVADFNVHFYRMIKWLVFLPFLAVVFGLFVSGR